MQIANHGHSCGFSKVNVGLEMILCMEFGVCWVGSYFVNEEQEKKGFVQIVYGSGDCGWWFQRLSGEVGNLRLEKLWFYIDGEICRTCSGWSCVSCS